MNEKKPDHRTERQKRLEEELRANLKKRKALARARAGADGSPAAPDEEAGDASRSGPPATD